MKNYGQVLINIRKELETYIINNNLKSLVLGISGGIDSALAAAIASPVCEKLNIPLIGRSLPISTNSSDEIERADNIGNLFCTNYTEVRDLNQDFVNMWSTLEFEDYGDQNLKTKLRMGNLKARMRMMYLYDLAQIHDGMVLSTDNWTE